MIIRWTNKFSGETGYVKAVSHKGEYFENTYDREQARDYKSAEKVIPTLERYCSNNIYTAE